METETFQALVNPGVEIDPYITQLTGIAQGDVADAPDISEVLPRFRAFVGDLPLVGFNNINFDSRFLKAAGMRHRSDEFDVMLYAGRFRAQLGFEKGRPGLAKLSERLQIVNPRAHRALADALTTARCLEALRHLADEAKP